MFAIPSNITEPSDDSLNCESEYDYIKRIVEDGYRDSAGKPLKCTKCGSTNLIETVTDTVGNHVAETSCNCSKCNTHLGDWAYGHWQW